MKRHKWGQSELLPKATGATGVRAGRPCLNCCGWWQIYVEPQRRRGGELQLIGYAPARNVEPQKLKRAPECRPLRRDSMDEPTGAAAGYRR